MSSIRYAVVGSRDWKEPWLVKALVFELFQKDPDGIIVSGGARGVDSFAEEEADILHMGKLIFPHNGSVMANQQGRLETS